MCREEKNISTSLTRLRNSYLITSKIQKQPPEVKNRKCSVKERCSKKLRKLRRKTPELESFFKFCNKGFPIQVLSVKFAKTLRTPTLKNICERLLLKIFSWNWEKLKFIHKGFWFYIKKQVFSTPILETNENVCFYFMVYFPWNLYSHTIFLWCDEK